MLEIKKITTGYGDMKVLDEVSMEVRDGETVALVGSNGAGKTTLLRAISGLATLWNGSILLDGTDISKVEPHLLPQLGIAHIPQGRGILHKMTVEDNLLLGGYTPRARGDRSKKLAEMLELFPILAERKTQLAGTMSGGQQQMLAIARALMLQPKLMIVDEPSLGLAPIVVKQVFTELAKVSKQGVSVLIVEQNLVEALGISQRGYVLETGRIVMEGAASELLANPQIREAYLGL
ncbi:MAG TPA: ABC transporter ATP-binding protein [Symbiobacteriaceae bacterium]|nr:ABC transporter ATP-binding protein [Symbiobacteriaceae bacterium]